MEARQRPRIAGLRTFEFVVPGAGGTAPPSSSSAAASAAAASAATPTTVSSSMASGGGTGTTAHVRGHSANSTTMLRSPPHASTSSAAAATAAATAAAANNNSSNGRTSPPPPSSTNNTGSTGGGDYSFTGGGPASPAAHLHPPTSRVPGYAYTSGPLSCCRRSGQVNMLTWDNRVLYSWQSPSTSFWSICFNRSAGVGPPSAGSGGGDHSSISHNSGDSLGPVASCAACLRSCCRLSSAHILFFILLCAMGVTLYSFLHIVTSDSTVGVGIDHDRYDRIAATVPEWTRMPNNTGPGGAVSLPRQLRNLLRTSAPTNTHNSHPPAYAPPALTPHTSTNTNSRTNSAGANGRTIMCLNTVQGRAFVTDSTGAVCRRSQLDARTGCCRPGVATTVDRLSCRTCRRDLKCCQSFEYCVSCCLRQNHPPNVALPTPTVDPADGFHTDASHTEGDEWSSPPELFDRCLHMCRTSSRSLKSGNRYRNDLKHCYSDANQNIALNFTESKVLTANAGVSCYRACSSIDMLCHEDYLPSINSCSHLTSHFKCEAGCEASFGADQPAYVDPHSAPNEQRPGMCLVNGDAQYFDCEGSQEHTHRLCLCIAHVN